jgi:hypothetical protein
MGGDRPWPCDRPSAFAEMPQTCGSPAQSPFDSASVAQPSSGFQGQGQQSAADSGQAQHGSESALIFIIINA